MAITVQTCPELCARQGTTKRHEIATLAVWMRLLRVTVRLLVGIGVVLALLALSRLSPALRRIVPPYMRHLYRKILKASHVDVIVDGPGTTFAVPGSAVLVVGNHVSWLDVVVLGSIQPVTMISKTEVREWPLIGAIAVKLGTIFLDRTSYDDVAATRSIAGEALREGKVVATFPEGTTTCGRGVGEFRSAMFQAAADAGVAVRPVALSYLDSDGNLTTAASFVGEMSLLQSVRNVLAQRYLTVKVAIRPLVVPTQVRPMSSRKALRQAAADSIGEALAPYVGKYDDHKRVITCQSGPIMVAEHENLLVGLDAPKSLLA